MYSFGVWLLSLIITLLRIIPVAGRTVVHSFLLMSNISLLFIHLLANTHSGLFLTWSSKKKKNVYWGPQTHRPKAQRKNGPISPTVKTSIVFRKSLRFKSEACLIFPYFKKENTGVKKEKSIKSHWDKLQSVTETLMKMWSPNPAKSTMKIHL